VFHPKVFEEDFEKLPDEILREVNEYFQKYKQDPFWHSSKLYNLGNLNLKGYRKTYVANATYRIIIKIENNITKVVEVVAVGQRQSKKVYKEAFKRIQK
jgi:mRNA interferase RelE/StbE